MLFSMQIIANCVWNSLTPQDVSAPLNERTVRGYELTAKRYGGRYCEKMVCFADPNTPRRIRFRGLR